MVTLNASDFKARCLAILDQVRDTGEPVLILKRGKPVAQLIPARSRSSRYPQDDLRGTVEIVGDVVAPAVPEGEWEALRDE